LNSVPPKNVPHRHKAIDPWPSLVAQTLTGGIYGFYGGAGATLWPMWQRLQCRSSDGAGNDPMIVMVATTILINSGQGLQ
jgi:hypothetical protein